MKDISIKLETMPQLICTCCVLHNICELHREAFPDEWFEIVRQNERHQPQVVNRRDMGVADARRIRETLTNCLTNH